MPLTLAATAGGAALPAAGAAVLCVLVGLAVARPVQAQGERIHTQFVVGGGLSFAGGDSVTDAGEGLAGHLGVRHQRERVLLSVRLGTNYGGTAPVNVPGGLRDRFDEVALMAGYAVYHSEKSLVVLSAGIASVSGERVGTGPAPHFGTSNVPFEARVGVPLQMTMSAPGGGSGFGLTAHVNLNREEVFGAFTVTYQIGLGRPRDRTPSRAKHSLLRRT
jgi:hypothetical protein